ncbi:MAG: rRNA pseudouridine synthase [Chitinophagaceae bacterium]|nr:rRNA pseudouridine synthase [Chitinophagaceae bacterium]
MANKPFAKFTEKIEKGAKKKERIRQEKKKIRSETKAYFDKKKAERYALRTQHGATDSSQSTRGSQENRPAPIQKTDNRKPIIAAPPAAKKTGAKLPVTKIPDPALPAKPAKVQEQMPLNKYLAHAGICSRRDAADIVKSGKVMVNDQKITEPGYKVKHGDEVKVAGKKITAQKNLVYILLNKPKDFITTTEDPQGRKTVLDIVKNATTERVYPIGRLDRNTTGVLLLTNDGELAQKLSHPSYEVRKIYEVTLDRQVSKKDFDTIAEGVMLDDGFVQPDALAYPDAKNKHVIGIEIHSGRNRIVRRIFEKLGYDVRNLDRVMYANLTKKNVDRGKWRMLSEKEVRLLKFLNASYNRKSAAADR